MRAINSGIRAIRFIESVRTSPVVSAAPENLQVTIENDDTVSKKVNVTATADWATLFEYHPGEAGADAVTANIGETASFTYKEAGTYTIKVVAKGAAIATTEKSQEFEVTAILAPTEILVDQHVNTFNEMFNKTKE